MILPFNNIRFSLFCKKRDNRLKSNSDNLILLSSYLSAYSANGESTLKFECPSTDAIGV